jgi:hypothetical protein
MFSVMEFSPSITPKQKEKIDRFQLGSVGCGNGEVSRREDRIIECNDDSLLIPLGSAYGSGNFVKLSP